MITIRAAQLIYSRVEIDYSSQRRSGYQTVYHSPSLLPDEVNLIERRIQCFQPPRPSDDRLQCFQLPSGKVVVSRTVQITPDPEITDRTRRPGAFLAHCLVLSPAEFAAVGSNAFALFEAFAFLDDPTLMVEDYIRAPSVEEPTQITVNTNLSFDTQWQEDEAFKLLSFALQANELLKARRGLVLIGSAEEIQEALRTAITRLEPSHRLACSFDTCVDRCLTQPGTYWAIGVAQRQAISGLTPIDVAARRVQNTPSVSPGNDLYLSWLQHVSKSPEASDQVRAYGPTMQSLSSAFAQHTRLQAADLDSEACAAFVAFHSKRVWSQVEAAFITSLGKGLASNLSLYVQSKGEQLDLAELLVGATGQKYPPHDLSELVVEWLLEEHSEIKDSDWKILADLATAAQNTTLRFLAIVSQKKVDHHARTALLEALPRSTVQQIRARLEFVAALPLFISPSHTSDIIDDLPATLPDHDLVAIIEAILDAGTEHVLDQLTPRVARLEPETVHTLLKLIRKHAEVPLTFRNALEDRRDESPRRLWHW